MKKLSIKLLATVALVFTATVATLAQGSFAYQAVIRNSDGSLVSNKDVKVRFTLHQGTTNYYVETQDLKTNAYGNISAMVGSGKKESGDFMSAPWSSMNVMLKIEVDAGKGFIDLGSIQLQPVPYALYAKETGKVTQTATAGDDEAIFEVKDSQGNLVFAVYPYGVKVFVDDSETADKVRRSGFYITGRESKDGDSDYFAVNAEGTQVFVDDTESDKVRRSGFYITGRESKDGSDNNYLKIDGSGTQVYVDLDDSDKVRRSGFLITGRDASAKGEDVDIFKIDGKGTQVFIDDTEDGDKVRRSGFLITGRDASAKDGEATEYLSVTSESIDFSSSSFNVADKKTSNKVLAVTNGNVHVNSDMLLTGEIGKVEAYTEDADEVEEDMPEGNSYYQFSYVVDGRHFFLDSINNSLVSYNNPTNIIYFDENGDPLASSQGAKIQVEFDSQISISLLDNITSETSIEFYTKVTDYYGDVVAINKVTVAIPTFEP